MCRNRRSSSFATTTAAEAARTAHRMAQCSRPKSAGWIQSRPTEPLDLGFFAPRPAKGRGSAEPSYVGLARELVAANTRKKEKELQTKIHALNLQNTEDAERTEDDKTATVDKCGQPTQTDLGEKARSVDENMTSTTAAAMEALPSWQRRAIERTERRCLLATAGTATVRTSARGSHQFAASDRKLLVAVSSGFRNHKPKREVAMRQEPEKPPLIDRLGHRAVRPRSSHSLQRRALKTKNLRNIGPRMGAAAARVEQAQRLATAALRS
eukprot:SAG31_NODE_7851_length_1583_cov_0.853774_2_plen_268_part_00